jgi:uncharacterized membrane protein YbaN (DUF454 family)
MLNRVLYYLGWASVGLAMAGVALPLVPTTPFVLLAAFCFARSSPAAYRRLVESPVLGPVLRDWEQHRGMRPKAKVGLFGVVVVVAATTMFFSPTGGIVQIFAAISVVLTAILLTVIRTIRL